MQKKFIGFIQHPITILLAQIVFVVVVFVGGLIVIIDDVRRRLGSVSVSSSHDYYDSACNIAVLKLEGELMSYIPWSELDEYMKPIYDETSAEKLVSAINNASTSRYIDAIILQIDSRGGSPVGAEEVMRALSQSPKHTVALIREAAASAGYLAALGADQIIASRLSEIGSIGIARGHSDYSQQYEREGIRYIDLSSGKFKNILHESKSLTDEEITILMRDVQIMHDIFVQYVVEKRDLDIQVVRALADGSTMLGDMALEKGLIDGIGGMESILASIKELVGIATVCDN